MSALYALLSEFGVDQYTVIAAFIGVFLRPARHWFAGHRPCFSSRGVAVVDAFNAAAIVPFAYLMGSVFFQSMLDDVLHASKASLGIAGLVGVIFALTELVAAPHRKNGDATPP